MPISTLNDPLPAATLHVVVDMQDLFDTNPDWGGGAVRNILPNVLALVRHRPERAVFTRFWPATEAQAASGQWRRLYERWPRVTLAASGIGVVELVPELKDWARRGRVIDKTAYSTFTSPAFGTILAAERPPCLLFTGVETDMCVLASVFDAVDSGHRVVIATDAVGSADRAAHEATLERLLPRFDAQVECVPTQAILANWR